MPSQSASRFPDAAISDLEQRLLRARFPVETPGEGWSRGVPTDYLRELTAYWVTEYDWRQHEARINEHPHFTVGIDGQTIHFMIVRSVEPAAKPLLMIHGWPGSFVEFTDVLGPLTDPRAHLTPSCATCGNSSAPFLSRARARRPDRQLLSR